VHIVQSAETTKKVCRGGGEDRGNFLRPHKKTVRKDQNGALENREGGVLVGCNGKVNAKRIKTNVSFEPEGIPFLENRERGAFSAARGVISPSCPAWTGGQEIPSKRKRIGSGLKEKRTIVSKSLVGVKSAINRNL